MKKFTLVTFSCISFIFFFSISISAATQFEKIWEFELNYSDPLNTVQSQPKEYLGKLFFVDGLGNLYALEKDNGKLLFKRFLGRFFKSTVEIKINTKNRSKETKWFNLTVIGGQT